MSDNLCLLVCDRFEREVSKAIAREGFDDVIVRSFPGNCVRSIVDHEILTTLIRSCQLDASRIHVLSCSLFAESLKMLESSSGFRQQQFDSCFELFIPHGMIEEYRRTGDYIVTPGVITTWSLMIQEWGFAAETAREYFAESVNRLVLLDTGVDQTAVENIEAFARFVDRPFVVVQIGLDHCRLVLSKIVLEWRLEKERSEFETTMSLVNRRAANQEMIMDLISRLPGMNKEKKVISSILELFMMLFAPVRLIYIPFFDDKPGEPTILPKTSYLDDVRRKHLENFTETYEWTDSKTGFVIRIQRQNETLGVLEIDQVAFPEYILQYLNQALSIIHVCGLAITNSRIYQKLEQVVSELEKHLSSQREVERILRESEERLLASNEELLSQNEELDAFAHTVAHDLKTPLTSVIGYTWMLQQDAPNMSLERMPDILATIKRNAVKMKVIIDELLLLASIRKADIIMQPLNMPAIVQEALGQLTELITTSGATIDIPDEFPNATGHAIWVEEIWVNLISNALKYGGEPPRIEIGATIIDGAWVKFWVRDFGKEIPLEDRDKLFLPFSRLKKVEGFGHGLGLSIVQRIIEKLGGQAGLENPPDHDEGNLFFFCLSRVDEHPLKKQE